MATSGPTSLDTLAADGACALARPLAPEEVRAGDYVALLQVLYEVPSFLWCQDTATQPREELVRLCCLPESAGVPLRVQSVCLPFVLVKHPAGGRRTLDIRRCRLARLDRRYAKAAWKLSKADCDQRDCR